MLIAPIMTHGRSTATGESKEDREADIFTIAEEMPAWKPGRQHGEPVRVQYDLPMKVIP